MTTKTFDAVELMRQLRDKLSNAMERLTPEERVRYIRDRAASTNLWPVVTENEGSSAGHDGPADRPLAGS